MGNSFLCLLASGFLATTVVLAVAMVAYISVKNYRRWRKLIKKDAKAADAELSATEKNYPRSASSPPLKPENEATTPSVAASGSRRTAAAAENVEREAKVGPRPTAPANAAVGRKSSPRNAEKTEFNNTGSVCGNKENDGSAAQIAVGAASQGVANDPVKSLETTSHVLCTGDKPLQCRRNKKHQLRSRIQLELNEKVARFANRGRNVAKWK